MNFSARTLIVFCLFAPIVAFAAKDSEPAATTPKKISIEFRGPLNDGLREIASKGGVNLVATGFKLSQPAEIYLRDVSVEDAIGTVASAYNLKVEKQGNIWTLHPMTSPIAVPSVPVVPAVPDVPVLSDEDKQDMKHELNNNALKDLKKLKKLKINIGRHHGGKEQVATGPVVIIKGQTVKSAVSFGDSVTVQTDAVVEGDAVAFGGDVILEPGSLVEGDAVSFGGQVKKDDDAVVEGEEISVGKTLGKSLGELAAKGVTKGITHVDEMKTDLADSTDKHWGWDLPSFLLRFALLFGLGFLFMMFAPDRMKQIENELKREPLKCGLTGLLGLIALVPLTILLIVTLVGIPLAIVMWLLVPVAIAMGVASVASEIGLRLPIFRTKKSQAVVLTLGLLVVLVAGEIPVLGPIAFSAICLIALGAIIRTRFGQRPKGFPEPEPSPVP